jgi:oligosaccharide repeat unit polymerase
VRPFYLYFVVWILPLTSALWFISDFNIGISTFSISYLVGLLGAFFVTSLLFSFMFPKKRTIAHLVEKFNSKKSIKLQVQLLIFWYAFFLLEVLVSGGLPILWGGQRGYGEFGIPTIHGLSNMLRALIFSNIVLLHFLGMRVPAWVTGASVFVLFSALVLEQSRGAFVMTLLFALGPLSVFMKISIVRLIKLSIVAPLTFMLLSIFQFLRYAKSPMEELLIIFNLAFQGDFYKYLIEPAANYIATPILNAGLNLDIADDFRFVPVETMLPLIPSFLREILFPGMETDYGALLNEGFNTTTYIVPFVRDFGLVGGFIVISSFFFYCTYVFFKARNGSVEHIIKLSPLMMCLALSFFTSYLTSLVTVVYILISRAVARRMV